MKNLFLMLFLGLALMSCKKATTTETTTTEGTTTEVKATETEMPDVSSSAVTDYMKAYDSYLEEYKEAVKSKNSEKMMALATKGQELAEKGQAALKDAKSEDLVKLQEYMKKKSEEFTAIAQGKY